MADPSASFASRLAAVEGRAVAAEARIGELAEAVERLRRVIEDAAERHAAELAGREAELAAERAERRRLELEVAELRRRLGMDSTNSSVPPSKEPIGAKERRRARQASERVRSKDRKPGGQPGHPGSGLAREADPDRSLRADPPGRCSSCQADLSGAEVLAEGWAQVWDVLEPVLEKVEWALPRRHCGCCGKVTAAAVPHVRAGCMSYGPRLNAAAVLLATEGNVPLERAAMLVTALLDVPVSSGFVARAVERLAATLDAAGFDAAMRTALGAEDVLCGDETPVNVLGRAVDDAGTPLAGTPHIVTVRTPAPGLVWYAPTHSRSAETIGDLKVLSDLRGYLVRDGYAD